jgi:hypothetical protein
MTAPKRRRERQPDPYLRAVDRYDKRGWTLPCDCCCHWWPDVDEAVPCCPNRGMRYIAAENAYVPWGSDDR